MSKKRNKWDKLTQTNFSSCVCHFQSIASDLSEYREKMEIVNADPDFTVSLDDVASLIVAIRNASALLQVMISAKQLQELRDENNKLRAK